MRFRFTVAGSIVFAALLAACSSTAGTNPTTSSSPAPVVTPLQYTLTGKETQLYQYAYGYPDPEPSAVITTGVTENVEVTTAVPPSPFPQNAYTDAQIAETDKTSLSTTNYSTNAYYTSNDTQHLLLGSTTTETAATSAQSLQEYTLYTTPQIVSEPGAASGATWTNSPAATLNEVYGDGHSENRVTTSSGTYQEIAQVPDPTGSGGFVPTNLEETSTGAGEYSGPFFGDVPNVTISFKAPSGGKIAGKFSQGTKTLSTFSFPAWYPVNGLGVSPPTFQTETYTYTASASLPSSCSGSGVTSAPKLSRVDRRLDTIIGYAEIEEVDEYETADNGPACVVLADEQEGFYNYNGDTGYLLYYSDNGNPLSLVSTNETLVQQGVGASSSAKHHASAAHGGPLLASGAFPGIAAHFDAKVGAVREALFQAMVKHYETTRSTTVGGKR